MTNGRSIGTDAVPMEAMKYCEVDRVIDMIVRHQNIIWDLEDISARWRDSKTVVLYKKGSRLICKNYRGLSITHNLSRITPMVINQRLEKVYEANIDNYPFGLRKDRSTVDNLFVYNQLRRSSAATTLALYADLTTAFDKLPRRLLWKVIELRTGSKKTRCDFTSVLPKHTCQYQQ